MEKKQAQGLKPSLSNGTIYLYGLGEFGYNFIYTFFSYYLMTFLTQFTGLPTAMAAIVYTIVSWIKMLIMPVGGAVVDGANVKSGKYRTLTLLGSIVMGIGLTLMFTRFPTNNSAVYTIIFLIVTAVGFLGYSVMYTSHRALMGPMSKNPADGVAMSTAAAQLGAGARILYGFMIAGILGIFGAGVAGSYTLGAAVCSLIMVICMFIVFKIAKPYELGKNSMAAVPKKEKLKGKDILDMLKSKPMLIFVLSMILRGAVLTIVTTILVIYINTVLQAPALIPLYMTITYLVQFFGSSIVRWTTNRFGRKQTFIVSTILSVIFIVLVKPFGGNPVAFVILMSLFQFTGIFASALMPVFMQDIGEYSEITNGSKARGFAYSIGGGALMLAGILGGMIGSFGLVAVGYNATAAMTAPVANGLTNLLAFGPSALSLLSCVIFAFYPLTEKYMEKLRADKAAAATPAEQ